MVHSIVITRVTDNNIFRERIWYQCEECGHKFEHFNRLFDQRKSNVKCPKCQSELTKGNIDMLD